MENKKPKSQYGIPENAKKVFEGKIFEVYQWEQEMFDGSKETFERLKRPDTANVLAFTEDGKIITLQQEQPGKDVFNSLPGGRVEKGEDIKEAAKRELLEETGYEAGEMELWHSFVPAVKIDWTMYFFVAKNCKKVSEQSLDCGEKICVNLVSLEEFLEMQLSGKMKGSEIIMKMIEENILAIDKEKTLDNIKKYFL